MSYVFKVGDEGPTRGGKRYRIIATDCPFTCEGVPQPIVGWIEGCTDPAAWCEDGRWITDGEHSYDLLPPVREVTRWVRGVPERRENPLEHWPLKPQMSHGNATELVYTVNHDGTIAAVRLASDKPNPVAADWKAVAEMEKQRADELQGRIDEANDYIKEYGKACQLPHVFHILKGNA